MGTGRRDLLVEVLHRLEGLLDEDAALLGAGPGENSMEACFVKAKPPKKFAAKSCACSVCRYSVPCNVNCSSITSVLRNTW